MDPEITQAIETAVKATSAVGGGVTLGQGGLMGVIGLVFFALVKDQIKNVWGLVRKNGNATKKNPNGSASQIRQMQVIETEVGNTKTMVIKLSESSIVMQSAMVDLKDTMKDVRKSLVSIDGKMGNLERRADGR